MHRFPDKLLGLIQHLALPALALLACAHTQALPEDATQDILVAAASSELFLDQGLVIYRGGDDSPATITQGSLVIAGSEIRIEQGKDGALRKITASGSPARYQQQPAVDQEVVHASGLTLVYDNSAQLLTVDAEAELLQAGTTLSGHRIEYDMQARRASATSSASGNDVKMTIPAPPASN
jgi:lipopolysaccharide export system protein LptA